MNVGKGPDGEVLDVVGFELASIDGDVATYKYFPENDRDNSGALRYDVVKKTFEVTKRALFDDFSSYSNHLLNRLRDAASIDDIPRSGYVAWY